MHAAAWKTAFDACLRDNPPPDPAARRPFDPGDDYRRHVDGRARLDGAAAFLASRGLRLPAGDPGDPPGTGTVRAVAALKERLFTERLGAGGIEAYPGTVRLLRALKRAGVPRAAASASRHAGELLESAGYGTCSTPSSTAGRRPGSGCPANPTPRSSWRPPPGWAYRPARPPSSRTRWPASRPAAAGDSAWSWA